MNTVEDTPQPITVGRRVQLPSYLSEDNRRELIACGFKAGDLAKCWSAHFNKMAIKGKCAACGQPVRVPPYVANILRHRNQKDKDRPHAMFVYKETVEAMEAVNPQLPQKPHYCRPEEDDDYCPDGPRRQCKVAATIPTADDADLVLLMEALGSSWEDASAAKRATALVPVCFECYLGAKAVTDPLGYRVTSIQSVPDLADKLRSPAHKPHDQQTEMAKGMIHMDQLRQRLAWCTLPGSRHCIHVTNNGKAGFKVCAKRRPPMYRDQLPDGYNPTYNDYCCMEHRHELGAENACVLPPPQYIGMFRKWAIY